MSKAPYVSAYQLEQSVSAWQQLQETLTEDPSLAVDEDVVGTPIVMPGDTPDPHVLLSRLIDAAIWADRRVEEAENLKKRYLQRQQRYEERSQKIRATISQLMEVLSVQAHEGDLGSVTMVKQPTHVIADVDKLAELYVRTTITRTPDKVLLGKLLRDGKQIEGATLSNPGWAPRLDPY